MKRLFRTLILVLAIIAILSSCTQVRQIADSVADAAKAKLKQYVEKILDKYKLDVVEIKTAFGKLNDNGGDYQFFVAALVRSKSPELPNLASQALGSAFTESGITGQSGPVVENPNLVHQSITFSHTDYSADGYYVIWGYVADISIDLPELPGLDQLPNLPNLDDITGTLGQ